MGEVKGPPKSLKKEKWDEPELLAVDQPPDGRQVLLWKLGAHEDASDVGSREVSVVVSIQTAEEHVVHSKLLLSAQFLSSSNPD
jgi:hypothetical protein